MPEGPTIDRSVVTPIIKSIEALGGDVETLIQDSGLRPSWSDVHSDEMPEANVWELFERSSRSLDMPDVGLRVGTAFEVGDLGDFGSQLKNSLTTLTCLGEYISTVNRYSSHSNFWLEKHNHGAWFCRRGIDLIDVGRREVEQFTLELMVRLTQLACGPKWRPTQIRIQDNTDRFFRDHPGYASLEIRCRQASTAIWLSSVDMLKVVRWDDDEMIRCIRDCVYLGRHDLRLTIQDVARQLGFSARTLQRELSSHGLDWSRLLDQVRLDRASSLLLTEMPLGEISRELGYTDPANFGRAFRRWTGTTPRSYRRLASGDESCLGN